MYTKKELIPSIQLLNDVSYLIEGSDSSSHSTFTLCAYEKKIKIFPVLQKPPDATLIANLTRSEILLGLNAREWDKIQRTIRDFIAEKILE